MLFGVVLTITFSFDGYFSWLVIGFGGYFTSLQSSIHYVEQIGGSDASF